MSGQGQPAIGEPAKESTREGVLRRRPPCRSFGGDARSQELAGRIVQRSAQISMLHRAQLADIAEFDRAEAWRGDGALSMVAWVAGQCGVGTSTARQWVRAASHLESLPCLAEGLASGELSLDLVAPLAEVASPETDAALREASAHWSVRQARELAAWHRAQREEQARSEPDQAGAAAGAAVGTATGTAADGGTDRIGTDGREFAHRTLHFNDTRRTVWVAFTKDDYAVVKSALISRVKADKLAAAQRADKLAAAQAADKLAAAQGADKLAAAQAAASEALEYVPYDKRLYDALMQLFRLGATPSRHGDDTEPRREGGAATGRGRPFRPRLIVHAPLEVLLGCSNGDVVELAGVGPISAEVARRLACDADVVLSVERRDGSVLDQGRARREPTVAQRIEIDRRDKGCRFPGCLFSEFTDVHHVEHWAEGGETSLYNLVTLCDRHHRAVHELGWLVQGDANAALTFTSPHGRVATSVPSPIWAGAAPRRTGAARRDLPMRC